MSLTYELARSDSAISQWMAAHFNTTSLFREVRAMLPTETIKPAGLTQEWPWARIGTAVDYRLRHRYGATWSDVHASIIADAGTMELLAWLIAADGEPLDWFTFDPFTFAPPVATRTVGGMAATLAILWHRHRNDEHTTPEIAALMWACAYGEEYYRAGWDESHPVRTWGRRLFPLTEHERWDELVGALATPEQASEQVVELAHEVIRQVPIEPTVLEDVSTVSDAATSSAGWRALRELMAAHFVENPTFAGSTDVGGADGDLIAGDVLVEIKTTINPARMLRDGLRQLIGYVALDYLDEWKIGKLGFFLPRQYGALVQIPLTRILAHSDFADHRAMQRSLKVALATDR